MADAKKILIVDDEPDILEFMKYNLEKEGYIVYTAENGSLAIEEAKKVDPDLIILDIMMPELDGIEVCHTLRELDQFKDTLITFLTARNEDYSQVAGFNAGADDYITKPIRPRVFVSRVAALLRRSGKTNAEAENQKLILGNVSIDLERFELKIDDKVINLPKKEFNIIHLLITKPGKVFSREEIYTKIWGSEVIVGTRTIDVHIRKLREKIGDKYIKTIKGIGYKFDFQ